MAKDIQSWNPEDEQEWAASGKSIATRNLRFQFPACYAVLPSGCTGALSPYKCSISGFRLQNPNCFPWRR